MQRLVIAAMAMVAVLAGVCPVSLASPAPRVFQCDGEALAAAKDKAAAGETRFVEFVKDIRKDADKVLTAGPFSVVDKSMTPPSGDKHDYMSLSPYWWPDPSKPDGKPYIRKDGQFNPEREKYDLPRMEAMADAVEQLAQGYYFTGEEKYAAKAGELMRAWFFEPATRMNPNVKYAQFRPGYDDLRAAGTLETNRLRKVVDADALLAGSKSWTADDSGKLKDWFRQLLTYMRESDQCKEEASAPNNHGTWYHVQAATYALYLGDEELAKKLLQKGRDKIKKQVEPDGSQPEELQRTNGYDYSRFNILAHEDLCMLGNRVGLDLWNFKTADGRSLRKAIDWLLPYATGEKKWNYQQIRSPKMMETATVLRRAANAYNDPKYEKAIEKIPNAPGDMTEVMFPRKTQ